ncbi:hypothetical protein F5144DRAFT_608848 [Chaetomium tenue]|uniref:Uncharacterized protein n=1 Tax=Chaetomium tenue TaxID=1854479 RepID=A0ACB7PPG3_9PEZI|nr:hypothetical protein F5144DRAFT_608848 [Chaetomium globosum]
MTPSPDDCDDTWVCPPCRLFILREYSRRPLKLPEKSKPPEKSKTSEKSKPRDKRPDVTFHMRYTPGEQQPAASGSEGDTEQGPKTGPSLSVYIDLTNFPVHLLLGDEPPEAPKPAEEGAPAQETQQLDHNKNGEQSPSQDANGPGTANTETQAPTARRRASGPFLDFLHPAFFYSDYNTGQSRAAPRAKAKKPRGGKGAKGRRGKQEVGDAKLLGLKTQQAENMSKS